MSSWTRDPNIVYCEYHVEYRFITMRRFTLDALGLVVERPGLAAQSLPRAVDPDVHGLHFVPLRKLHVLSLHHLAELSAS